jgi:hypothetical protein
MDTSQGKGRKQIIGALSNLQCNLEFGTNSPLAVEPGKTIENVDKDGQSQDLLNAN